MRPRLALAAVTTVVLITPLLGCGAVQKALDCANTAVVIVDSVDALQRAVSDGVENPEETRESLDRIDRNLDRIGDNTGDADVDKAVDNLQKAVDNTREAIEQGKTPDMSPVVDAADELTSVCSPG